MINTDICVIGAGPAGLAASIEAARYGAKVTLIDENISAGGQLFKQIHKFFGSRAHHAGTRGIDIGEMMLSEAKQLGVEIRLRTVAYGIFEDGIIGINDVEKGVIGQIKAKKTIIATGALENALPFKGWTKAGVMGAGAAQTLMNLYRVKPGNNVLMVGTGNVGLIVSYQMLQAGINVIAVVEAAPVITGYHVHARKLMRAGVPIYTSATVKEVLGGECIEKAIIVGVDECCNPIEGEEMVLNVDVVCVAVGLTPLSELVSMAECDFKFVKPLGGFVPKHDINMRTSKENIYVAGDVAGIEEASSAMEEGRIAGISAAHELGFINDSEADTLKKQYTERLCQLREGPFGIARSCSKSELMEEDVLC